MVVSGNGLCALCNLARARRYLDSARQHVSPRSLACVADESISLHGPHNRMGRYSNVHHFRPALRTMRSGVYVARRHDL